MGTIDYNKVLNDLIDTYKGKFKEINELINTYKTTSNKKPTDKIFELTGLADEKQKPFLAISKELIHSAVEHTIMQKLVLKQESKYDLYLLPAAIKDIKDLHNKILDNPEIINVQIKVLETKIEERNKCITIIEALTTINVVTMPNIIDFVNNYNKYKSIL